MRKQFCIICIMVILLMVTSSISCAELNIISPEVIVNVYQKNPVRGDLIYRDNLITLRAEVVGINKPTKEVIFLDIGYSILCFFDIKEEWAVSQLEIGDKILIEGFFMGCYNDIFIIEKSKILEEDSYEPGPILEKEDL